MSEEQQSDFGLELDRLFGKFIEHIKADEVEKASTTMNAIWVLFQVQATAVTSSLEELTYLKTPFEFDNGGKYMLTFTHVDGPKIKLKGSSGNGITKPFEEVK